MKGVAIVKTKDLEVYCELREQTKSVAGAEDREGFISFLRYCAERLDKGDSVQAIWNDFQGKEK